MAGEVVDNVRERSGQKLTALCSGSVDCSARNLIGRRSKRSEVRRHSDVKRQKEEEKKWANGRVKLA